ncbi:MAG: 16S rRNA (guanine(966)-N(2))-methyltransferase RsmD [Actinobacteria bacterium]|nr:MAG: 16S rRNA (guanine(966)-N(2))-methyltransferase RsmD [Actinomycetota bacterium]
MRIIAGAAKGRPLTAPQAGTRPLTARARQALFNSLGSALDGALVLDLYAGSGSLGLEALSRGAAGAVFVESGRRAAHALRGNVATVGLGGEVVVDDVVRFLGRDDRAYDLIFVDPPYEEPAAVVDRVIALAAARLAQGAILVVHRRSGDQAPSADFPAHLERRRYGDATLYLFHRDATP